MTKRERRSRRRPWEFSENSWTVIRLHPVPDTCLAYCEILRTHYWGSAVRAGDCTKAAHSTDPESARNLSPEDVVTIIRSQPLPPVCIPTGEETSRKIRCLFHWKTTPFYAGVGPLETLFEGIRFYLQDVPKANLWIPVSSSLYRRRIIALMLLGAAVMATIATCLALLFGQQWIDGMPKGPQQKQLNDFLIPAIALVGVATILPSALLANKLMPRITTRLKVEQITATHVQLCGVHRQFSQALKMTHDEKRIVDCKIANEDVPAI